MKKLLVILLSYFPSSTVLSQTNLVLNPSFETFTACPSALGEIYKANGWDQCNGTSPDYFNFCSSNASVPSNDFGYQYPSQGNSYAGIITYYNAALAREIITASLTQPLIPSQKYYVSFKVNRGNDNIFVGYSSNKIGVKLSVTKPTTVAIDNAPIFYSNNVITDTLNWTKVFGSFTSNLNYQYLMIGNFFDDANTTVTNQSSGIYAYYFIDDVCLGTDSSFVYEYATGVTEPSMNSVSKIYPNPANERLNLEFDRSVQGKIEDLYGKVIIEKRFSIGSNSIDVGEWKEGVYFLKVNSKIQKFMINHED